MANEFKYQIENKQFNKIKNRCDISNILNSSENTFLNTFFDDLRVNNGILVLEIIGREGNLMESWKPILRKIAKYEQTQIFLTRYDKMDQDSGLMYITHPSGEIDEFIQGWVPVLKKTEHSGCTECNHCQDDNNIIEENFSQAEADKQERDEYFSRNPDEC